MDFIEQFFPASLRIAVYFPAVRIGVTGSKIPAKEIAEIDLPGTEIPPHQNRLRNGKEE